MQPSERAGGRPGYDQALKWMLGQAPQEVVDLLQPGQPGQPGLTWQRALSPELPAVARQADLVWEVTAADGERGILHLELQTTPDAAMGARLAEYGLRLWLRDHLPVRSVVVFLRPAQTLPQSPFVIHFLGQERLRYAFEVVRLWEVPQERVLASPRYELWPLAGAMAGVTPETTAQVAERLAGVEAATRQARSDLIGLLATLAGLRLPLRTVLATLRRNQMLDDLLRESTVVQEWIEEGKQLGLQEGKREGAEEGARQMAQRMARAALEGHFGPLSEEMVVALQHADVAALQEIVAHLTTETLEQVRARLGL